MTIGDELLITTLEANQQRRHRAAQVHPTGLASLGDGTIITVGDSVTVGRTHLNTGEYRHLADLPLRAAGHELCAEPAGSLLIAAHYGEGPDTPIAVGRLSLVAPEVSRDVEAVAAVSASPTPTRAIQQPALDLETTISSPVAVKAAPVGRGTRRGGSLLVGSVRRTRVEPTVVDLFAGSGGMTLGFAQEGYRPVFAVDLDLAASATYAANFGEMQLRLTDIRAFRGDEIYPADVLVGAPPTQGFSGWADPQRPDPRNNLWHDFWRIAMEVRPYVFVMVTAPRFLRSGEFRALLQAADGNSSDFKLSYEIAQAADYGVAQERQHAIIIGSRIGAIPLPTPTTQFSEEYKTVRDCIGDVDPHPYARDLPGITTSLLGQKLRGTFRGYDIHLGRQITSLSRHRYTLIPPGGDIRDLPIDLLPRHHLRQSPASSAGVMGRMRWDAPASAIRPEFFKPEKGRYLHPDQHRAITHYEAALLQGFPPDYRWCGSKTEIARQVGNATPVALAAAIARHVKGYLP